MSAVFEALIKDILREETILGLDVFNDFLQCGLVFKQLLRRPRADLGLAFPRPTEPGLHRRGSKQVAR